MYELNTDKLKNSPRAIKFWECCLAVFYDNLSLFKSTKTELDNNTIVNINNLMESKEIDFYLP
jgi:hypothetical protein